MHDTEIAFVKQWWFYKRVKYNRGLIAGGILAFIIYCVLASITPPNDEFEINLFTIIILGTMYLIAMVLANILYTLGSITDLLFNKTNSQDFRELLFALGYWFSVIIPSVIISNSFIQYFLINPL